jgi:protein-tyrosine-phosphatase
MTTILLVGAADTGRAPMAAALLGRLLDARQYAWAVESCGVLGHDGAPAEIEARDTMVHMGLDISEHQARSIDDELVQRAALIVTIDHGTALVMRARFPGAVSRVYSLGELAGRSRDIPDPFRMQIGAWMTYAREIESMLEAALPRMAELMPKTTTDDRPRINDHSPPSVSTVSGERTAAAGRIAQLLQVAAQMPGVIDWTAARARIEADLAPIAAAPCDAGDLVAAYVALLRAALALLPGAPSAGQLAALQRAAASLPAPIGQADLNELSAQMALLPGLA